MKLPYEESWIVSQYRAAKNKREIITILAQLNVTQTGVIKEILARNGEDIPQTTQKRRKLTSKQEESLERVKYAGR